MLLTPLPALQPDSWPSDPQLPAVSAEPGVVPVTIQLLEVKTQQRAQIVQWET